MPKGPVGAPRPLAEYQIVVDMDTNDVKLEKVGPLGGPRPFAKDNPPVDDDRVAECMLSDAGRRFGAGVVSDGATKSMDDLSPAQKQAALELSEKWCRGLLESAAIRQIEEGESIEALSRVRVTLANLSGNEDNITLDLEEVDSGSEAQNEVVELISGDE